MLTGRKRRSTPLDENSNPDTFDMQSGNAKVPRLRRSRSLRVLYDETRENVQEVRQQARHHGGGDGENSRPVTPAREEAQDDDHPGYDGADEIEFRGFDDGNRAVNAGNGRCQREILGKVLSLTGSMLMSAAGASPYYGWVLTDLEDIADVTCGQTAPVV
ncbi:unnamed protein product [Heligmosomoides polygyrus]|uniref:Pecanex-like protein n=1 Tax=Heligmosomoides polygyrus TaxID=6339 RepID=A0A183GWN0_HELPZ|nr:unnamed protein product [Heligmosomoides polygyrus]